MPKWIYFICFWSSARSRVDTAAASCSRAGQSKLQDPIPWGKSIAVHDWTCTVCVHCRIRWCTLWLKGLASSGFPRSIMKWKNFKWISQLKPVHCVLLRPPLCHAAQMCTICMKSISIYFSNKHNNYAILRPKIDFVWAKWNLSCHKLP